MLLHHLARRQRHHHHPYTSSNSLFKRVTTTTKVLLLNTTRHVSSSTTSEGSRRTTTQQYVLRTLLGVPIVVGGIIYAVDEGSRRSVSFWSEAFPIYLHYRWTQWKVHGMPPSEQDAAYNRLHDMYAPRAEALVLRMKGFYLKNAQLFSTLDYYLPPQYLAFCKRMQSEVPTDFAPGEARATIERSLGRSIDEVFVEFDDDPVGNASIGQVHRARLARDPTRVVAIKVQSPGMENKFRSDLATLISFCKLAMPQHVGAMSEIQKQFVTEFNYRGEAQNLEDVANNIMPVFGKRVCVPRPVIDLCTRDVLVMDFLDGKSLVKGIRESYDQFAKSMGKTLQQLEAEEVAKTKAEGYVMNDIKTEKHKVGWYSWYLEWKEMVVNAPISLFNATLGELYPNLKFDRVKYHRLLNLAEIIELLSDVHAHEIMVNGVFSADPHPGNVLLMPDGRLGLIDYGQTKRISKEVRIATARLIIALANDDQKEVIRVMRQDLGASSKYMNNEITWRLSKFWFDTNVKEVTGGRNIQDFLDWCQAMDPAKVTPEETVMVGRVSVMLRGLANAFGIDLRTSKLWEKVALEVLKNEGVSYVPECNSRAF